MKTPMNAMTPDFTPMMKLMALQTRIALQTSQTMMKLALMPFRAMPGGLSPATPAAAQAPEAATPAPKAQVQPDPMPATAPSEAPVIEAEAAAPAPEPAEAPAEQPVMDTPAASAPETDLAETADEVAPAFLAAPEGEMDDLTALDGVGPKLAAALNETGIYHFSQIASWTEANVAWIDAHVPGVRGRCARNGWVLQAAALAG